jgi:hypothetical protein
MDQANQCCDDELQTAIPAKQPVHAKDSSTHQANPFYNAKEETAAPQQIMLEAQPPKRENGNQRIVSSPDLALAAKKNRTKTGNPLLQKLAGAWEESKSEKPFGNNTAEHMSVASLQPTSPKSACTIASKDAKRLNRTIDTTLSIKSKLSTATLMGKKKEEEPRKERGPTISETLAPVIGAHVEICSLHKEPISGDNSKKHCLCCSDDKSASCCVII